MRPEFPLSIEDGVRNICLGRVLLKEDVNAGVTSIPVGTRFNTDPNLGALGSMLFYNNPYNTSDEAVVVQPSAEDRPDDIEHQETVSIDVANLSTKNQDLPIEGGLANSYSIDRGAYVRLRDLPEVCTSVKMISEDFLNPAIEPLDSWFPCILVNQYQKQRLQGQGSNVHDIYRHDIVVTYGETIGDWDTDHATGMVDQLESLLRQDTHFGGAAHYGTIQRAVMAPQPGYLQNQGRSLATKQNNLINWGRIFLQANRYRIVIKTPKYAT